MISYLYYGFRGFHGYPAQKSAQSENPQTELAMNDEDFQDDKLWKSLADIDWDKNWSEIEKICGSGG